MLAIRGKKFGFDKVLKIIVTGGASMMQFHHSGGVAASLAAMVKAEAISGGHAGVVEFLQGVAAMCVWSTLAEWIGFAKKRLNKFYNSKLYKPPALGVIAMMDSTTPLEHAQQPKAFHAFIQISKNEQLNPPPEAVGAYKKKGKESDIVIAMIHRLLIEKTKTMAQMDPISRPALKVKSSGRQGTHGCGTHGCQAGLSSMNISSKTWRMRSRMKSKMRH